LPLFGWRTRYWSFLLKLSKRLPSWTIQAQPGPAIGPFHCENRRLSVEELARLQTFPKRLKFVGGRMSIQKQLGNAVPSLLAEVLARAIAEQFFGVEFNGPPRLAVPPKRPVPPPLKPDAVPQKFLGLVGEHEDHPGEGLGRRARRDGRDQIESLLSP
jgi:DNA (cytosine-5)-methyltransferase 1